MRRLRWLRGQDVSVLFAIIAVIVLPAMLTLNTVKVPITGSDVKLNPTPLGYTVSLLIYLVPVLALYWWFSRRCPEGDGAIRRNSRVVLGRLLAPPREYQLDYRRSAYRRTLLTLIPLGFLLDIVLGHEFLKFDNREATLTIIPLFRAFDFTKGQFVPHIPVEEFVFYTLGFMAILSVYVWCDEYWLDRYNVPDYEVPPSGTRGLPPFIAQVQIRTPLIVSIALVSAAFAYKRLLAPPFAHEGFPWYFTFLVVASLFPAILLFRSTQRFINWRAVSFTVFWVVVTSLIWEATLASPCTLRTLDQSASSSSATSVASPVNGPCPNSICFTRTVTVSSVPMRTNALGAKLLVELSGRRTCAAPDCAIDDPGFR